MYSFVLTCTYKYKQIHGNTYQYVLIQNIGLTIRVQYTHDLYWHVFLVLVCIVFANTSAIHANTSQYRPNTLMTGTKPVVGDGLVLVCICMYFACIVHVFACICLYWEPSTTTGFVPVVLLVLHVLVCIRMYSTCIGMYCACIYKQFSHEYEHTCQYEQNTNTEFMYVLCM